MRISRYVLCLLFAGGLLVVGGVAAAGERCHIIYTNGLDETILGLRVKYSTPYDEPRFDNSRISLPAGRDYSIGVQGAILPELIIVDLATKSYVFTDLSGLNPADRMHIAIERVENTPLIRRIDAEGEVEGRERGYLTAANRPNAVDKDHVMEVAGYDELMELIRERIGEAAESQGELEAFDLEAGPIWNQRYALERCPEVAREWSEKNGREARWTGHWLTTVPGEMSVCGCVAGTADEKGTVFVEDEWRGETTYFPVFWMEWFGVGYAATTGGSGEGMTIGMRFRLPDENVTEMLGELLEDLRVDGYRPVRFAVEAADLNGDGDAEELLNEEIDFRAADGDKWDAHDRIMALLDAGYAGTTVEASLVWVDDGAFEEVKAGGEVPETRAILCRFTKDILEVVFVSDGSVFLY